MYKSLIAGFSVTIECFADFDIEPEEHFQFSTHNNKAGDPVASSMIKYLYVA